MPKDNKNNKRYSKEFKASILKRIESSNEPVPKIAEEVNIAKSTIYQWLRANNKTENKKVTPTSNKPSAKWSSRDKFHIVLETYTLTEEELAAYCRRKGLYVDEVKAWREQCLRANIAVTKDPKETDEELKAEKQRTKELEKELRMKEKALAETAALLVLRKKANAIWGDPEED